MHEPYCKKEVLLNFSKKKKGRLTRGLGILFLLLALGIVPACSSGGGGSAGTTPPSSLTTAEVEAGAKTKVSGTSNTVFGALGKSGSGSEASGTILMAMGITPSPTPDPDPTSEFEQNFINMLEFLLQNGVRNGDTITYDPDDTAACADPVLKDLDVALLRGGSTQTCAEFFSHILLVINIGTAADNGTIDFMYDAFRLMRIGFSPNSVYYEWDLAQCRLIFEAMFAQGFIPDPEFGSAFEGVVRTTLTELGPDHGRINLSVQQAIKIIDGDESFSVATTAKVFELTANGDDGTAKAEIGLSTLAAMFFEEDDTFVDRLIELDMSAATLVADLTPTKLIFTGVGLGGSPFTMDVDDPSSPNTDFSFGMDTFGLTIDGTDDTLTFDQAYSSAFDIEDVFGLFSSSITGSSTDVTVTAGSKWTLVGTVFGDPQFTVDSGIASVVGTGFFTGASNSFTTGSCLVVRRSFGFPFGRCP